MLCVFPPPTLTPQPPTVSPLQWCFYHPPAHQESFWFCSPLWHLSDNPLICIAAFLSPCVWAKSKQGRTFPIWSDLHKTQGHLRCHPDGFMALNVTPIYLRDPHMNESRCVYLNVYQRISEYIYMHHNYFTHYFSHTAVIKQKKNPYTVDLGKKSVLWGLPVGCTVLISLSPMNFISTLMSRYSTV